MKSPQTFIQFLTSLDIKVFVTLFQRGPFDNQVNLNTKSFNNKTFRKNKRENFTVLTEVFIKFFV